MNNNLLGDVVKINNKEKPRERLLKYGKEKLSNEELLSILLGFGTKNKSVRELSLEIINKYKDINNLQTATISNLMEIKGIGVSKSCIILALIELGKRIFLETIEEDKISLSNPKSIFEGTKYLFNNKKQELFYALYFNNKYQLVGKELLFIGTVNKSLIHPREIFKHAYLYSATSIVCMHNHPSGDVSPSTEDLNLTKALVEIGNIQKINVVDHIIVSNDKYYSFSENKDIFL